MNLEMDVWDSVYLGCLQGFWRNFGMYRSVSQEKNVQLLKVLLKWSVSESGKTIAE